MQQKQMERYSDVWVFVICVFFLSILINWFNTVKGIAIPVSIAPFGVGMLAFFFQLFINKQPLVELYSKGHPYRKLKPYGVLSAFLLFEFIIVWGLQTSQIMTTGNSLFLITVVFIGSIVYYHTFVRMKISLRFLSLAILIPAVGIGVALGLSSYFNIARFVLPAEKVGNIVLFNTIYWILFNIFAQMICEEPAFRGYLLQRLLSKGEAFAIVLSSLIYALWYIPFVMLSGQGILYILLALAGNFVMGAIFAILFIKGRNLLIAVLCHGIIDGIRDSLFVAGPHPGIRGYVEFISPKGDVKLAAIWFGCLLIGLILLTVVPRKRFYAH